MVEQKIFIDVPTEKEAKNIVDELKKIIRKYGYARAVSLYEVIGKYNVIPPEVQVYIDDCEYGWTREEDIAYRGNNFDGWQVVLPVHEIIKPQKNTEEKKSTKVKVYFAIEK